MRKVAHQWVLSNLFLPTQAFRSYLFRISSRALQVRASPLLHIQVLLLLEMKVVFCRGAHQAFFDTNFHQAQSPVRTICDDEY